jgi:hypothetical protein
LACSLPVCRPELPDAYQHQYEESSPEKYHVIKQLFDQWASEKRSKTLVASP